jgi:hypothetical protein
LLDEAQTLARKSENPLLQRRVLETRMRQSVGSDTERTPPKPSGPR